MNIFVWRAYGNVRVFEVDTVPQLSNLFQEICEAVAGWAVDNEIGKAKKYIEKCPEDPVRYVKAINFLIDSIGVGSHEIFEYSTGFDELIR